MNPLSYAAELIGLAVLLYLYDSSVLLCGNEAVLTYAGRDRWSVSWGWTGFLLAGRTLCMPNPFLPQRPTFRVGWVFGRAAAPGADQGWERRAEPLRTLGAPVVVAGLALFVVLPAGLFGPLGAYGIGVALACLYGSTLLALWRLHRQRDPLQIGARRFWGLAFECLACPPFAVNLVRRISLSWRIAEPLPVAAARLLDAVQWTHLRDECLTRIDGSLQATEAGSSEYRALEAEKEWLRGCGRAS